VIRGQDADLESEEPMVDVTPGWRHVGTVPDGVAVSVGGPNPWPLQWHRLDEPPINVQDPLYPAQRHRMWVYELRSPDPTVRFAAGEFSNGVWDFYVPA
jgi:hypothetical protein